MKPVAVRVLFDQQWPLSQRVAPADYRAKGE